MSAKSRSEFGVSNQNRVLFVFKDVHLATVCLDSTIVALQKVKCIETPVHHCYKHKMIRHANDDSMRTSPSLIEDRSGPIDPVFAGDVPTG